MRSLIDLLAREGYARYDGEEITQLTHALQSADLATILFILEMIMGHDVHSTWRGSPLFLMG